MNSVIQPYDILMLAVLIGAILFGAWKGLAWQLASLASLILSGFVAVHFSTPLAPYFSAQEPWNRFIAMFVLYMLTSLAIWIAFRFIKGIIERVKLKEFDRQMGALVGQVALFKHWTHLLGVVSQTGVAPEQVVLSVHWTHAPVGVHAGRVGVAAAHWAATLQAAHVPVPEQIGAVAGQVALVRHWGIQTSGV